MEPITIYATVEKDNKCFLLYVDQYGTPYRYELDENKHVLGELKGEYTPYPIGNVDWVALMQDSSEKNYYYHLSSCLFAYKFDKKVRVIKWFI